MGGYQRVVYPANKRTVGNELHVKKYFFVLHCLAALLHHHSLPCNILITLRKINKKYVLIKLVTEII